MTIDRELTDLEYQLMNECEKLLHAIKGIVNNWAEGDLAGAVNNAEQSANEVADFIASIWTNSL